jgi:hypothetical protein
VFFGTGCRTTTLNVNNAGIANTTPDGAIEVTDEMIEIGVRVSRERDAFDFFDSAILAKIVCEVYVAMRRHQCDVIPRPSK